MHFISNDWLIIESYLNNLLSPICCIRINIAGNNISGASIICREGLMWPESTSVLSAYYLLHILLTLAALVRRHRLREHHRKFLEESRLSGSRHARNFLILD
jgi:hypothetical protein